MKYDIKHTNLYYIQFILGIFFGYILMLMRREDPDLMELLARIVTGTMFFVVGIGQMVMHVVSISKEAGPTSKKTVNFLYLLDFFMLAGLIFGVYFLDDSLNYTDFALYFFVAFCILCHLLYISLRANIAGILNDKEKTYQNKTQT